VIAARSGYPRGSRRTGTNVQRSWRRVGCGGRVLRTAARESSQGRKAAALSGMACAVANLAAAPSTGVAVRAHR